MEGPAKPTTQSKNFAFNIAEKKTFYATLMTYSSPLHGKS